MSAEAAVRFEFNARAARMARIARAAAEAAASRSRDRRAEADVIVARRLEMLGGEVARPPSAV